MLANQTISIGDSLLIALVGITVVLIELALLAVIILLLSKAIRLLEKKGAHSGKAAVQPMEAPPVIPIQTAPAAVPAAPTAVMENGILLVDTDEQTAAMLMAIVSDQTGIPLERLQFKSIRQVTVDSKTEAVLLAIISDKTGIPPERLIIKSIQEID